jgi:hypothetical protein
MARINEWKVISTPWSYQLLFFPSSLVSLHIFCSSPLSTISYSSATYDLQLTLHKNGEKPNSIFDRELAV